MGRGLGDSERRWNSKLDREKDSEEGTVINGEYWSYSYSSKAADVYVGQWSRNYLERSFPPPGASKQTQRQMTLGRKTTNMFYMYIDTCIYVSVVLYGGKQGYESALPVPLFFFQNACSFQINQPTRCNDFSSLLFDFIFCSSTRFGRPYAHHQGLNNCSSSLWFYLRSVVIAVLLVVVGQVI
jgi:hypothetical protein